MSSSLNEDLVKIFEEGFVDHGDQDTAKSSRYDNTKEPLNAHGQLISVASDASSTLECLPSQPKETEFRDEGQSHHTDFEASRLALLSQANLPGPAGHVVEDFPILGQPTRPVGRWTIMNQVPHVKPNHARVLSGITITNFGGSPSGSSTSQHGSLSDGEPLPKPSQPQNEVDCSLERDGEENGARISINAISPDVEWETILESKQTSHDNEMADLMEDHAAELEALRAKNATQILQTRNKHASALATIKQLKVKNEDLCKEKASEAEQLVQKEEVLQRVVANHQGLQSRFEQLEAELLRSQGSEAKARSSSPTHDSADLVRIAALEATVQDQGQHLRIAQETNMGMAAALAKDKMEAEFYADKVHELTYRLEDKPPGDSEKDRLLEYKDKLYKDLNDGCSEAIEALQARVQTLEKEAELDKASSSEEITALKSDLERKSRLNSDLEARKNAFQSANKSIFDMRKRPADNEEFQTAMDECFQLVQDENSFLKETIEYQATEIGMAKVEIVSLQAVIRGSQTVEEEQAQIILNLKEQKRSQECEMGRLQAEVEILPSQHKEALANKDAWIAHYNRKANAIEHEKNAFIDSGLDYWVRETLQCKKQETSRLQRDLKNYSSANQQLYDDLAKMAEVRTQDAAYAYADSQVSEISKDRAIAAEEEARKLREEIFNLREYHNPIRNKENKDIEEVLKESEELQKAHAKFKAESQEKINSLRALQSQGDNWAHAVKDVGCDLLARITSLRNTLQVYGIEDGGNEQDTLIARYNGLLDLVEDDEAESEAGSPILPAEQILADFDEALAEHSLKRSQDVEPEVTSLAISDASRPSIAIARPLPETPNTRAQRIVAEKERALKNSIRQ